MTDRTRGAALPVLVTLAALMAGVVYSQVGWRRARAAGIEAQAVTQRLRHALRFPRDGEHLGHSELRVIDGQDTVALAKLVRGRAAVIYFARDGCAPCEWYRVQMDSVYPAWRDSVLIVMTPSDSATRGPIAGLRLDSVSALQFVGVPALLVVDAQGFVRHAGGPGLPATIKMTEFAGLPSPAQRFLAELTAKGVATPWPVAGDAPSSSP